ncbi:MAG TPA: hypothetical protein DIT19_01520 [Desulfonauticus sp.]|jgi:predicted negative regulator of RcsB-dependent stress response|nr:MAG: hypothetical protein XD41_1753 [Desulfonauticus sp. 38_4375]HCO11893.1 hypothetical protein [Desulfonauticus sp.]
MEENKKNILEQIEEEADETIHPFLEFIVNNLKTIGIVLGGVIILVGAYSGYKYYKYSSLNKAKKELGMLIVSSKDREKDLLSFLTKAPSELKPSIYVELVSLYFENNNLDKAYDVLENLKKLDDDIFAVCVLSQVNILMDKGDYKEAYNLVSTIDLDKYKNYKRETLFKKAFLAEKMNDFKNAYAYYVELKKEFKQEDTSYLDAKISNLKEKI